MKHLTFSGWVLFCMQKGVLHGMALNDREKLFAIKYFECKCNAYQAALAAGYSEKTAVDASRWINPDEDTNAKKRKSKSKFKPELYQHIKETAAELEEKAIADANEVLKYLSSVMRKESLSSVLARAEDGSDIVIQKPPDEKEALKAAELLGKAHVIFTDKVDQQIDMDLNVNIKRV